MKKSFFVFAFCLGVFGLFSVMDAYGQVSNKKGNGELVTVEAAKKLPDDTKVTLQGVITSSLGGKKYTFRDGTGEITVKIDIDHKIWRMLSVGENDRVKIHGEVDVGKKGMEIDVKTIEKL
jgi:uncharacterized protein (TIGR00156 family)